MFGRFPRQFSLQVFLLKTTKHATSSSRVFPSSQALSLSHQFTHRRSLSSNQEQPPKNETKPPKRSFFHLLSIENKVKKLIQAAGFTDDEDLSQLIARSVNLGWYSVLGMTLLGTIGFDTKPLIASLGVAGFAAGYALKDAATHFTSGIMLVLQKPFKKGDYIKLLLAVPHEGIVESIDVRYVHLRNKDNHELLIPSSVVYANSILVSPKPPADWPPSPSFSPTPIPSVPPSPTSTGEKQK
jgi:small-conductance mechanosensitive channel